MSLTTTDLQQIRGIMREEVRLVVREEVRLLVREEVTSALDQKLQPIYDKLETLENDIKELYFMVARIEKGNVTYSSFQKLSLENKLLKLNAELLAAAEQAGIKLPR